MKQQQLLYDKGLTNVPSDAICSDNALSDAVGMVYDEGEHRVIQKPAHKTNLGGSGYRLLLVHQLPTNDKNYIVANGNSLYWRTETTEGSTVNYHPLNIIIPTDITANQLSVIGKTIIIATADGLKYAVWQGTDYKTFGGISAPHYRFYLVHNKDNDRVYSYKEGSFFDHNGQTITLADDHVEEYNNAVVGAYSENKKEIARRKGFCEPFFVRMAVELYDGSYTHISQPILMLPSMIENSYSINPDDGEDTDNFTLITHFSRLYFYTTVDNPFSGMEDIVKGIAVFVSDGVNIYDTNNKQKVEVYYTPSDRDSWCYDGVWSESAIQTAAGAHNERESEGNICHMLRNRPYSEIVSDLRGTSVFYKLAEIDPYAYSTNNEHYRLADLFETHTLENITTHESLKNDDYYSFSEIKATTLYAYNSRVNIAGLSRSFFEGFDQFSQMQRGNYRYDIYVRIKGTDNNHYVKKTVSSPYTPLWWFYYPDPRADWVTIRETPTGSLTTTVVLDTKLTTHEGLNGAYYFRGMPAMDQGHHALYDDLIVKNPSGTIPANATLGGTESLPNQIATSEVNNPWVFNASGYNTIGNGRVLAMTTQTRALSEGQFGQYPLLVFCNDGIWAMSVDRTGLFQTIQPMSREVITEGTFPVQTDGAVFFASKKGLMAVVGGDVQCVSQQLSGRANGSGIGSIGFPEFLQNAFFAYDYRDSLIWIFNRYSGFEEECYVYAIRSGTFAKYVFQSPIANVCNDYPDTLLQVENYNAEILSLTGRPDINDNNNDNNSTYEAVLTTRPVKLENALALKAILQMHHVNTLSSDAILQVKIEASNNLSDAPGSWVTLRSLHGAPWKYYRFTYTFSNLKPTDRFAGTVLLIDERRTSKLR